MIQAASWSGLPRSVGGGFGACIEWPVHVDLPSIVGDIFEIDGKDCQVIRVVRLHRDKRGKKPSSRIAIVVDEGAGER